VVVAVPVVVAAAVVVTAPGLAASFFSTPKAITAEIIATKKRMPAATYQPTWRPGKFG